MSSPLPPVLSRARIEKRAAIAHRHADLIAPGATQRLTRPQDVQSGLMVGVAAVALVADLAALALLRRGQAGREFRRHGGHLVGALATCMGNVGARTVREFQETEIIIAPAIRTEGKVFQTIQGVGMGK